jgi:hypothetical protein
MRGLRSHCAHGAEVFTAKLICAAATSILSAVTCLAQMQMPQPPAVHLE